MPLVTILRATSDHPDFLTLRRRLDEFLAILNGAQDVFYAPLNRTDALPTAVVAYASGGPVGIGAFRPTDGETVEIKRMYVDPAARGAGVGKAILEDLERWAREEGYTRAVLETSKRLEPAVRLYGRSGYAVIPNYGPYMDVEDSVCMAKTL
jgi:GNAT superfamily N-acetyltransferase